MGLAFLAAIPYIGNLYFAGNEVKYGTAMNIFGKNEGGFFLLYALFGMVALICFSMASGDFIPRTWKRLKVKIGGVRPGRVVVILAAAVFIAALLIRLLVVQQAPMTDDENAYLFGARIMLKGQLYLEGYPPELRPFLGNQFVVMGDRVYTQYCPGFILLLAVALKLGLVPILNPLMGALGIIGTFLLVKEVSKSPWMGLGAAVLLTLSPTYIFTCSLLFANPSALVFGVFGLLHIYRAAGEAKFSSLALGVGLMGFMFLIRPLSTAILGLLGLFVILAASQPIRKKLKMILLAGLIGAFFILLLLGYFALLTGDPLKTTYAAYDESVGKTQPALGFRHFFSGNFLNLLTIPFLRYNFWLLGWPFSLILIFALPRGKIRRYLFPAVLGIWLVHLMWKVVGVNITGAVHYFEMIPMLIACVAAAIARLLARREGFMVAGTMNFVVFSTLMALTIYFPWVTHNLDQLAEENLRPYRLEARVEKPAVILTKPFRSYRRNVSWTFYRVNNDIELENDILWLNRVEDEDYTVLAEYFPGRHFYVLYYKRDHPLTMEGNYWLEEIRPGDSR